MGTKTGKPRGRPKGSRNKITSNASARKIAMRQTPLEFMLDIMYDETNELHVRMDAAKSAAPYTHARLQSVTVQEKPYEGDPNSITSEYLAHVVTSGGSSDVITTAPSKGKPH